MIQYEPIHTAQPCNIVFQSTLCWWRLPRVVLVQNLALVGLILNTSFWVVGSTGMLLCAVDVVQSLLAFTLWLMDQATLGLLYSLN